MMKECLGSPPDDLEASTVSDYIQACDASHHVDLVLVTCMGTGLMSEHLFVEHSMVEECLNVHHVPCLFFHRSSVLVPELQSSMMASNPGSAFDL